MLTVSNGLSFARIPLAFVFLIDNPLLRFAAVILAMITDSIDGYLARKSRSVSRFGAILDPVTDKFFVYFAFTVLACEGKLQAWQALVMLSRDFALLLYGGWVTMTRRWNTLVIRSIRWGKITTALQFVVLSGLIFCYSFSSLTYSLFIMMGLFAFLELFWSTKRFYTSST